MVLRRLLVALALAFPLPSFAAPPPKVSTYKPLETELSDRPFVAKRILMVSQDVAGCATTPWPTHRTRTVPLTSPPPQPCCERRYRHRYP
jgi:hypothetical protein